MLVKAIPLDLEYLSASDFNQYNTFVGWRGRYRWEPPLAAWSEGAATDWAHVISPGAYLYWAWAQLELSLSQPGTWTIENLSIALMNNLGQGLVPLANGGNADFVVPDDNGSGPVTATNRYSVESQIAQGSGFASLGEGFYDTPGYAPSSDLPAYIGVNFSVRAPNGLALPPGEQDRIVAWNSASLVTLRPNVDVPPPPPPPASAIQARSGQGGVIRLH